MYTFKVSSEYHNYRIDLYLLSQLPEFSRSMLQNQIKQGKVLIDSNPCKPKTTLAAGEKVEFFYTETKIFDEPEDIDLDIVYENEDFYVINKPAGLTVHPGAGQKKHTLLNALLHINPNANSLPRAGIVHRLDKHTSGLMVVAKNAESAEYLAKQIKAKTVLRYYQALVKGIIPAAIVTIDAPIKRHQHNRTKMAIATNGKPASTIIIQRQNFNNLSKVYLQLQTGRTHQIRLHLAHVGYPILGDTTYGVKYPGIQRQALHAYKLMIPYNGKILSFTKEPPADFTNLENLICKNIENN